jgi:hypothetical protein
MREARSNLKAVGEPSICGGQSHILCEGTGSGIHDKIVGMSWKERRGAQESWVWAAFE